MAYKSSITVAAANELFSVMGVSFELDDFHGGYRSIREGQTFKHRQKLMNCVKATLRQLVTGEEVNDV